MYGLIPAAASSPSAGDGIAGRVRALAGGALHGWAGLGQPVGVHLDGGVARLVQFAAGEGTSAGAPLAAAAVPIPPGAGTGADPRADADAADAIRSALSAYRFRGRRAVGCVPSHASEGGGGGGVVLQNLRLPAAAAGETPEELAGMIRFELADRLPFAPEEAEIRHLPPRPLVRHGEAVREVVVVAARRDAALRTARLLASAGLRVVAVDAEPLAAARALAAPTAPGAGGGAGRGDGGRAVLLHLGAGCTQVLLAEGGTVLLAKTLPGGAATWDAAVARHTGLEPRTAAATRTAAFAVDALDPADDLHRSVASALREPLTKLADEVELVARHFRVLFRGARAEALRAGGPHAPPWLVGHLADRLGLPPVLPDPAARGPAASPHGPPPTMPGRPGAWAAACGLAGRPGASAAGAAVRGLRFALSHPLGAGR